LSPLGAFGGKVVGVNGFEMAGETPEARRGELAEASDGAVAEQLFALARRVAAVDLEALAAAARLPVDEVTAGPFTAAAIGLGVEEGVTTVALELRRQDPWPARLAPASVRDPAHGTWSRGVLHRGKYQGFLQDEPLAAYDPSHFAKWAPHEMLHRAAGFFFRPGMSRWELYLGARLGEVVPVVAWYGAEQALRGPEERAFHRLDEARSHAAGAVEGAFLRLDDAALRARCARAVATIRTGLTHFERELAAIDRELLTGVVQPCPWRHLDSSSDAMAYAVGHGARLADPTVAAALGGMPGASADLEDYRDRVVGLFDRLLFGPWFVPPSPTARLRRRLADWVHRLAHRGIDGAALLEGDLDAGRRWIDGRLAEAEADAVLADGLDGLDLEQLAAGLASVAPRSLERFEEDRLGALADAIARGGRRPLAARLAAALRAEGRTRWAELAELEGAIAAAPRDDAVERLAEPRRDDEAGVLFAHRGAAILEPTHDVMASYGLDEGFAPEAGAPLIVVGRPDGDVSVVPCPSVTWFRGLQARARPVAEARAALDVPDPDPWIDELLDAGALGWRGAAR
jgi:hypothetical protein